MAIMPRKMVCDTSWPPENDYASMVCIPCKRRKKGCDKKLPICSRCERLSAPCCYLQEDEGREQRAFSSTLSISTCERSSPSILSYGLPLNFDDIAAHALRDLIDYVRPSQAEQDFSHYFSFYHINLPIINHENFTHKLMQQSQDPHFVLLKLAVSLVAQLTSEVPDAASRGRDLYARTRAIYSQYQTNNTISIDLLLAGLLLATYEYCQGSMRQSWLTVGVCARMGQILKLELQIDSPNEGYPVWWWGVIILERLIACNFMNNALPLISDPPQPVDLLPTMDFMDVPGRLVNHDLYLAESVDEHGSFIPTPVRFTSLTPFSTTIQATYLNRLVTDHLLRGSETFEIRRINTERLTLVLEHYEKVLTPPAGEAVGHYCGAYGLQTCAIFRLHENELLRARKVGDFEQIARSKHVLQTVARTIAISLRDVIGTVVTPDVVTLALWSHKIVYHVAMAHVRYGVRDDEWEADLERFKRYLRYLSDNMKLHEQYLREVEEEEIRLGQ